MMISFFRFRPRQSGPSGTPKEPAQPGAFGDGQTEKPKASVLTESGLFCLTGQAAGSQVPSMKAIGGVGLREKGAWRELQAHSVKARQIGSDGGARVMVEATARTEDNRR